ncbi:hypothetical protein F4779DRAFT_307130 [Xylariaceae sp. FL0662B]|nr:hypothetical protein F4779DRAFT_307130 [Xylariaceae sp. FL0662B]
MDDTSSGLRDGGLFGRRNRGGGTRSGTVGIFMGIFAFVFFFLGKGSGRRVGIVEMGLIPLVCRSARGGAGQGERGEGNGRCMQGCVDEKGEERTGKQRRIKMATKELASLGPFGEVEIVRPGYAVRCVRTTDTGCAVQCRWTMVQGGRKGERFAGYFCQYTCT